MKKKIIILLVVIFVLVLVPFNDSKAITQNQIDSEVHVVCPGNDNNWYSGSGTIISSKGIIITNRHVVQNTDGSIIPYCIIGESNGLNSFADFSSENFAEVKYYSTVKDLDVAILYIVNSNRSFGYFDIFNSNSYLSSGDKIEAVGYPGYSDFKLILTDGSYLGKGTGNLKNYIEASTYINHGNSGGAAYNYNKFVGVPSLGITTSEGIRYFFLSMDSIKNWMKLTLGTNYETDILGYTPVQVPSPVSLPNDFKPPHYNQLEVGLNQYNENNELKNHSSIRESAAIYEFPKVSFEWDQDCFGETDQIQRDVCIIDDESSIKGYYYYFGTNPTALPAVDGNYILASAMSHDTYYKLNGTSWNDPNGVKLPFIFDAQKGKNYFILQAQDANGNISNPLINIEYIYEADNFKDIKSFTMKKLNNETLGVLNYPVRDTWDYESHVIETNQTSLIVCPDYGYEIDGLVYYISYQSDRWWFDKTRAGIVTKNQCITINNLNGKGVTNLFIKPNTYSINNFFGKHLVLTIHYINNISNTIQPASKVLMINYPNTTVSWEESKNTMTFQKVDKVDLDIINRLRGKILLQVENNGEAWYVKPDDNKRYYMKDGSTAYQMMRLFSLGITNENLYTIPNVANTTEMKNSTPICTQNTLANQLRGKILLQVEEHGEAWYVDPVKCRTIYMKDGSMAYEIMRFLGLGITNTDLSKIPIGNL